MWVQKPDHRAGRVLGGVCRQELPSAPRAERRREGASQDA